MTSDERLSRIRVKIERARRHHRELKGEVQTFLEGRPYKIEAKRDPRTSRLHYFIASVKDTPPEIAAITGDILHNLRSALDHLAYQLVALGTGVKGPFRYVYFPITESAKQFKTEGMKKIQGVSLEARKAIEALMPYKGGNDTLWRLHNLDNVDKHRLLITVGSAYQSVNIGSRMRRSLIRAQKEAGFEGADDIPLLDLALRPADRLFPLKAGDVLFEDELDAEIDEHLKFQLEIAFGEPEVGEGETILETLGQMIDEVDEIILSFKPFLD